MSLERLRTVSEKDERLIIGLMSGTSVDGIDAALVKVGGSFTDTRLELVDFITCPFDPQLRADTLAAFDGDAGFLCELNFRLGEAFSKAALDLAEEAGVKLDAVDAIASSGQTVYHIDRSQGGVPSTLQLGEASVIAERTGRLVVSDFRTRDVAAGGAGAPLVPYVDFVLYAREAEELALQNIGGIANVTVLPRRAEPERLLAFDTGPGNMVIDEVVKELRDDEEAFDEDGRFSALGRVDEPLLGRLLSHPYFELGPPKSTGRELFGADFCEELIEDYDPYRLVDLLATAVELTARSIFHAYERFVFPQHRLSRVIVSGGGGHNRTLMGRLKHLFGEEGIPVDAWDDLPDPGFPGDAKEAVAFAVLANETLQGKPSNCPAATGALRPVIQGKISL